ncbi:MAG: ATPase [Proteobacteria bacterium]|nr:ATPase [Pseudomonadota bacterium]
MLALTAIAAWSGWFGWANQRELLAATPAQAAGWIGLWAQPVLLVAVVWLLAMRSSRRETARFADAARQLEAESARLEARLASTNGELSLAREFLAAQGRDLDALGRQAVERLSTHADQLAALIHSNAAQIEGIGSVSTTALENMERLRGQLPVLANAAKDVANNIGTAGRTAHAQLRELIGGFNQLNEFGQAAERLIVTTRAQLETALARFGEQLADLDAAHGERVAALTSHGSALETRLATQQAALTAYDNAAAARQLAHGEQTAKLGAEAAAVQARMEAIEAQIGAIAARAEATGAVLDGQLDELATRLAEARAALATTSAELGAVTDGSVRLLELIQAGVKHGRDDLPRAIGSGEERLAALEARAVALGASIDGARASGEALSDYVLATHEQLGATATRLTALHDGLAGKAEAHSAALDGIEARIASVDATTSAAAARTEADLAGAIERLATANAELIDQFRTSGSRTVATLAEQLGEASGGAIDKAMRGSADAIAGQLEQAAAHAAGVTREAALQLRNQLSKVDELVGNLERRVEQARNRAEEQVDHDFARRVALITESLHSNAIDIARALDADVGDTAWAAYLRGDRGIFTRRAVRLLDPAEAKSVLQLYEADANFADHVSRYIHDFEAMLRQLLSTRDGHALGVTLLSSDMGKLYVALAQAIERLRN